MANEYEMMAIVNYAEFTGSIAAIVQMLREDFVTATRAMDMVATALDKLKIKQAEADVVAGVAV